MARCPAKRCGGMEIVLAAAIPTPAADGYAYVPNIVDQYRKPSQAPSASRGGILPGMTTIDFAEAVRRRLAERGQSQYRAALNSGLPQDAIRSVLNGHIPRLNRVEQICRALGLELYIGPPRDVQVEADGSETSRPLTRFSSSVQLPVRAISQPSPEVFLMESEEEDQTRPAPVDLDDPQAFYALFHGYSMVPSGIGPADFCLVSPCAKLEPGQRVWLRDRKGARRAAVADQADSDHLRGGRLAAAEAERPPGPRPRAVGAQGRRGPRRHPGGVPRLGGSVGPGAPASRLAPWPTHRFVASAVRRGTGAPGCGSGASGKRRPPPSIGGSRAGSSRVRSSAPTCRICCSKSRA